MEIRKSKLELSYRQFCIFNEDVINPFNEWDVDRVAQGFSIRKDSLSVMSINEYGTLNVCLLKNSEMLNNANRIIEFEYKIKNDFLIIATITAEMKFKVQKGNWVIRIQLVQENDSEESCYISFEKKQQGISYPHYIKFDDEITKHDNFIIDSNPA